MSLDKPPTVPSHCRYLAVDRGDLDRRRVSVANQANIAGVHGKHPTVSPVSREIDLVQAPLCGALDRLVATPKIIEMESDEFTTGNSEIECELLSRGDGASADGLPFLNDSANTSRQMFEMHRLPAILRHAAE